jgi:hypothetical protein
MTARIPASSLSASWLASELDEEEAAELLRRIPKPKARKLRHLWEYRRRIEQTPPPGDWRVWLLLAGRGFGKLLDVKTPIPTPTGWTSMGELHVGDAVFDEAGRPCRVLWASEVQHERTYSIRFSDGAELIAGGSHQWVTWTHAERKAYLRSAHERSKTNFPENWPAWRCHRLPTK